MEQNYEILFGVYQRKINELTSQNIAWEAKAIELSQQLQEIQNTTKSKTPVKKSDAGEF